MAKQEEIKKGLERICAKVRLIEAGHDSQGIYGAMGYKYLEPKVDEILSYLHSQGVVIKVDRELPHLMPQVPNNEYSEGYCAGESNILNILIEVGYVAVEPLIKKGK